MRKLQPKVAFCGVKALPAPNLAAVGEVQLFLRINTDTVEAGTLLAKNQHPVRPGPRAERAFPRNINWLQCWMELSSW
jgi:hypothetical protein